MLGRKDVALRDLEKALALGWLYVSDLDDASLPDFGDEPAFRSLRGDKRFEAIRARVNKGIARERRETMASGAASLSI